MKNVRCNILIVGYRGYSDSEGEPSEIGLRNYFYYYLFKEMDSIAILDYIFSRNDIDLNKVYVHGRSLGGAVGIYALT